MANVLFTNVRIIDGTGAQAYAGEVLVQGNRILRVARGALVLVELRNIGWVEGSVAWKQDNRFGIAFVDEIDPVVVRGPAAPSPEFDAPRYTRTHVNVPIAQRSDTSRLRKI